MLTFLSGLAGNVVVGWVLRRVGEVAGLLAFLLSLVLSLPPAYQDVIIALLTGQGGGLTITAILGLLGYLWAQYRSYRATVTPQVVTSDKTKHELPVLTEEQARDLVEQQTGRRPTGPVTRR